MSNEQRDALQHALIHLQDEAIDWGEQETIEQAADLALVLAEWDKAEDGVFNVS